MRKAWDTEVYELKRVHDNERANMKHDYDLYRSELTHVVFMQNVMTWLDNVKLRCCK